MTGKAKWTDGWMDGLSSTVMACNMEHKSFTVLVEQTLVFFLVFSGLMHFSVISTPWVRVMTRNEKLSQSK